MRLPRNTIALGVVTINLPRLALISKSKNEFIENLKKLTYEAININNVITLIFGMNLSNFGRSCNTE